MRVFDCTRVTVLALCALLGVGRAGAQPATAPPPPGPDPGATFTVFARGVAVGSEVISVEPSGDGWAVRASGRLGDASTLTLRQFDATYDRAWNGVRLTIDATLRGVPSLLRSTIADGRVTTRVEPLPTPDAAADVQPVAADALWWPAPFVAPYEAIAARLRTASAGSTLTLVQPGQGSARASVGVSTQERVTTVDRTIAVRRTPLTVPLAGGEAVAIEVWADEAGHLLRVRIPDQGWEAARADMTAVSTRTVTMARPNDEDVRVPANGFSLAGTVSKALRPAARQPAVVLLGGVSPADRNGTVAGIPLFAQLGAALADAGYLVLRYDQRGTGQSGGRTESAALADYADDARAAVDYLAERRDVDRDRIALVGYGDGASIALIAATKAKRVTAVALLAAPGRPGAALNTWQVERALRRSGRPEDEKARTLALQLQIQQAVLSGRGWEPLALPDAVRRQADTPWFQSLLAFDPARVLRDVSQPVLVIHGGLDTQIPAEDAATLLAASRQRPRGGAAQIVTVPQVNHLLVQATTGENDEYPLLVGATVSAAVTSPLIDWLGRVVPTTR